MLIYYQIYYVLFLLRLNDLKNLNIKLTIFKYDK